MSIEQLAAPSMSQLTADWDSIESQFRQLSGFLISKMEKANEGLPGKTSELQAKVQEFKEKISPDQTPLKTTHNGSYAMGLTGATHVTVGETTPAVIKNLRTSIEDNNAPEHSEKVEQDNKDISWHWPKNDRRPKPKIESPVWRERTPNSEANLDFEWPKRESPPVAETRRAPAEIIYRYSYEAKKSPGILNRIKSVLRRPPKTEKSIADYQQEEKTIHRHAVRRAVGIAAVALVAVGSGAILGNQLKSHEHQTHIKEASLTAEKAQPQPHVEQTITIVPVEVSSVRSSVKLMRGENPWAVARKILVQQGISQPSRQQIVDKDTQILKLNNLTSIQAQYLQDGYELTVE